MSHDIVIRIQFPGNDPQPDLPRSNLTVPSPGSEARWTYHHIVPWRICVAMGALFVKLAIYADSATHQSRFRGDPALMVPQPFESTGALFEGGDGAQGVKAQLLRVASGLAPAGTTWYEHTNPRRSLNDLTSALNRSYRDGEGTRLDSFLLWHRDGRDVQNPNIALFSRPPFAGFWGMLGEQRQDEPGQNVEANLPLSMDPNKRDLLREFAASAMAALGQALEGGASVDLRTSTQLVKALLTKVEPLTGRHNYVQPFQPSDWLFRPRGDQTFLERWHYAPIEELTVATVGNVGAAPACRNNSFRLRKRGEAVTGARLDEGPRHAILPRPIVWNRAGERDTMHVF